MNFQAYLRAHNYPNDLSVDDRKTVYVAYRKWYKKQHQQKRRRQAHRLELMLSEKEYSTLEKAAKKHGKPLATFTREVSLAYLENLYVLPDDETVQELEVGIRRIGNNVNQLTIYTHKQQGIDPSVIAALRAQLQDLEKFLSRKLREPQNLTFLVEQALKEHPNYAPILQRILTSYL